ncbi:cytochrome p450 [Moniliophthora roreri]|nr:cytochrome p450 [Moniliophthora roreri]
MFLSRFTRNDRKEPNSALSIDPGQASRLYHCSCPCLSCTLGHHCKPNITPFRNLPSKTTSSTVASVVYHSFPTIPTTPPLTSLEASQTYMIPFYHNFVTFPPHKATYTPRTKAASNYGKTLAELVAVSTPSTIEFYISGRDTEAAAFPTRAIERQVWLRIFRGPSAAGLREIET